MYWYYKASILILLVLGSLFAYTQCSPKNQAQFLPANATTQNTDTIEPQAKVDTVKPEPKDIPKTLPVTTVKALDPPIVSEDIKPDIPTAIQVQNLSLALKNGQELIQEKNYDRALDLLQLELSKHAQFSPNWLKVAKSISSVNTTLLGRVTSVRKAKHTVSNGDTLSGLATGKTTVRAIQRSNNMPFTRDVIRLNQHLSYFEGPWEIHISKSHFMLALYRKKELFKLYHIATGREQHSTPTGTFIISGKKMDPDWDHPEYGHIPYGDSRNVLGTRWMRLISSNDPALSGYGIHGTNSPQSIGSKASLGCIRLKNSDVEELYDIIPENSVQVKIED